ncbi:MAG: hypothetical protein Q9159_005993 [Coniocarpon cinnabarinum]
MRTDKSTIRTLILGGKLDTIGANDLAGCHLVFAASKHAVVCAHILESGEAIETLLQRFKDKCEALHNYDGPESDGGKDLLRPASTSTYLLHGYIDERKDPSYNRNLRPYREAIWARVRAMKLSELTPKPLEFQYLLTKRYLEYVGRLKEADEINEEPKDGTAFVYGDGNAQPRFYIEDKLVAIGAIKG